MGICTEIVIKNASRYGLELSDYHFFRGGIWKYPLPTFIESKKNGYFLHVKRAFRLSGSSGGLSYNIVNTNLRVDILWHNPFVGNNWYISYIYIKNLNSI